MGLARWLCDALTAGRIRFDEAVGYARSRCRSDARLHRLARSAWASSTSSPAFATASGAEYLDQLRTTHVDDFYWSATRLGGGRCAERSRTAANRQSLLKPAFALWAESGQWVGVDLAARRSRERKASRHGPPPRPNWTSFGRLLSLDSDYSSQRGSSLRLAGGSAIDAAGSGRRRSRGVDGLDVGRTLSMSGRQNVS